MNKVKRCKKCLQIKNITEYYKHKTNKDKLQFVCKKCFYLIVKEYERTPKGLITKIYKSQKSRSLKKGYNLPEYTKNELIQWVFKDKLWNKLYNNWKKSNYDKYFIPSIDRVDDYKPYTLDNIQLMTWKQNHKKGNDYRKNGINNKQNKAVLQYDIEGNFIKEYYSISQAERETKIRHIQECCKKRDKSNHCGGYMWMYKSDLLPPSKTNVTLPGN